MIEYGKSFHGTVSAVASHERHPAATELGRVGVQNLHPSTGLGHTDTVLADDRGQVGDARDGATLVGYRRNDRMLWSASFGSIQRNPVHSKS